MRPLRIILVLTMFALMAWQAAEQYFAKTYNWPTALALGVVMVVTMALAVRSVNKPAPFQLVTRLYAKGKEAEVDDRVFKILHDRFKAQFHRRAIVRFDGFDTDGESVWFYFSGPDSKTVQAAVRVQIADCCLREGSFFEEVGVGKTAISEISRNR
ncbi:MAG: hypothetical protein ABMA26_25065 [Limisphaerales bacterium]